MQLPIQSGVRTDKTGFVASYPVNLQHEVIESGLSKGQLVTARGIVPFATGPGKDRGGTVFKGEHYRVMGGQLCKVGPTGSVVQLGSVGNDLRPVSFAQDFDRLAIRSAEKLFYWFGNELKQVADFDLGKVFDVAWMDGYFITTDGEFIAVTELLDPTQVDALKYGSAENDPDPVVGVQVFREELYAFGRETIQVFRNVGGTGFPFQNVRGATIPYGAISANAKTRIGDTLAFVGGAKGDPIGVYVLAGGSAIRVSDSEIDGFLAAAKESEILLETRRFGEEDQLMIHTDARTLVLSTRAASESNAGTWHIAQSGNFKRYRGRNAVYAYGRHIVGDTESNALGTLTFDEETHFGEPAQWRFDSGMLFNNGMGVIVRAVELFGRFPSKPNSVFLSMTRDGQGWSKEAVRQLSGRRDERVQWRPNCSVGDMVGFRFRGSGRVAIARAEITPEGLAV